MLGEHTVGARDPAESCSLRGPEAVESALGRGPAPRGVGGVSSAGRGQSEMGEKQRKWGPRSAP